MRDILLYCGGLDRTVSRMTTLVALSFLQNVFAEGFSKALKDVRANCFCASFCARNFTRHVMHERAR